MKKLFILLTCAVPIFCLNAACEKTCNADKDCPPEIPVCTNLGSSKCCMSAKISSEYSRGRMPTT